MTHPADAHLDDEALSAVLDGAGTEVEARHVEGCATCPARLDELRAAASLVASPVPPIDPERLDAAVAAALSAQNVVPLSVARGARRPPAWLGAAAAVAAVLGIAGLIGGAGSSDDDGSGDQVAATDAAELSGEEAGDDMATDDMATMESDATTESMAAPVAGSSGAPSGLGELRGADLQAAIEGRLAQRTGDAPTTTVPGGGDGASGGGSAATPCEPELRASDPALGAVTFVGDGTWDGEPVAVVVFEVGAERRAFVAAYDGCAVRATATWQA